MAGGVSSRPPGLTASSGLGVEGGGSRARVLNPGVESFWLHGLGVWEYGCRVKGSQKNVGSC